MADKIQADKNESISETESDESENPPPIIEPKIQNELFNKLLQENPEAKKVMT